MEPNTPLVSDALIRPEDLTGDWPICPSATICGRINDLMGREPHLSRAIVGRSMAIIKSIGPEPLTPERGRTIAASFTALLWSSLVVLDAAHRRNWSGIVPEWPDTPMAEGGRP